MTHYLDVALPVPLRNTFSYATEENVTVGTRVRVRFGNRPLIGIVTGTRDERPSSDFDIKQIEEALDEAPLINTELMQLSLWAAQYYHHPIGEVLFSTLPQWLRSGQHPPQENVYRLTPEGKGLSDASLKRAKKQQALIAYLLENETLNQSKISANGFSSATIKALMDKGLVEMTAEAWQPPTNQENNQRLLKEPPKNLNSEQQTAFSLVNYHAFHSYLLDGATGSGKTEVYFHAIARVLGAGRQALLLIPEIGLSPQTVSRVHARFNVNVVELHSNISEKKRAANWEAARTGRAQIVVGTRLASLTPFRDLGIIIVDEEHDKSFKQQEGFKYSARDVSIYRAHKLNIPIILGSATPSLESLFNVKQKKYCHLKLTQRAGNATPPNIHIVDAKQQTLSSGLTQEAYSAVSKALSKGSHAMIFVNRRGYAPTLMCHHCSWIAECPSCESRVNVHMHPRNHTHCHRCQRKTPIPKHCPQCGSKELSTFGTGTEQIETTLQKLFPNTEVVRIDRDSTRAKNAMATKLAKTEAGKPCLLVGTQMLAKGHHIPNLNLVVVVDADQGLLGADYRGVETMGQLITQVSGRSGRADTSGEVIVQSHHPEHPLLLCLLHEGYATFAEKLLLERAQTKLPPYSHSAMFRASSKRLDICETFLNTVKGVFSNQDGKISTFGPMPANIDKVNDRFRHVLVLQARSRQDLHRAIQSSLDQIQELPISKRVQWGIDVDPIEN